MIPTNLDQTPDAKLTSRQEIYPNIVNLNKGLSSEKSPPYTNALNANNIDKIRNLENDEISDDEESVDLRPPDTPDSVLMTDSGEELTDDDDQPLVEQSPDAVTERAVSSSSSYYQYPKQPPDEPSRRRPIRESQGNLHNKEWNFSHTKEKIIEFFNKYQQEYFIEKKLMASIVSIGVFLVLGLVYNFVAPVNEISPMSTHYYISEEIINRYPTQDKRDLKNLIRVINNLNRGKHETDKIAVITILYSHRETAECLAKTTANYAVKVINRNEDFVRLNGSLNNADFYLGNENFKKDIEGKGVLVVYDFHNFSAEKVRYFHGICDKHTPYIEDKAVYIILLEMSKNQEEITKKLEKVQSRIEELWSPLKSEILYPLGIRLMDNVLVVREEPKLSWC